ncbi:MAG: hypothetical protein J6572_07995, partial [Gilliamella sp.]|nr:hypothetical protein [Gilliamella sp.]
VNRSDTLSLCNAPYKVTLDSSEGTLETRYGMPNSSTFSGGTAEYYITPPSQPVICSVRPNLLVGGTSGLAWDDPRYAGPANIWNPVKGFLVQSTNPSSYGLNFPTTGSDGLYFDLDIVGVDASQLSWTVNTSGSITATVSWTKPRTGTFTDPLWGSIVQYDSWIRDKSKNVTRVTLNGPRASSSQISSSNPGQITVPTLPQTFELVGRDSSGNEVRYGFVLRQWFVNRGVQLKAYSDQLAWCRSLGYRLSKVRDLTNSNYNNLGATPSSGWNRYQRNIGAGFFTEWGYMDRYTDAGFVSNDFWTSDATGSSQFLVYSSSGFVNSLSAGNSRSGVCTAP